MAALVVNRDVVLPDSELSWVAVRSGGPGGQNVNKVSTKVELRFRASQSAALSEPVRARLLQIAARRLDAEGNLIVTCDVTRSQAQNLELSRQKLVELIQMALRPPVPRKPTRPTRASQRRRLADKAHASRKKSERRVRED